MAEPATGTQAVDRAAHLLATVVRADEPISFGDLVDECELPKSTASRLLAALERTDLLQRDEDAAYVAGPLFTTYAAKHDRWAELARIAMPALESLRDATGESTTIGLGWAGRVWHVAQADSSFLLGTQDWTEIDVPAHASATGKVLEAFGAVTPAGPRTRITAATIVSTKRYQRELTQVRKRGYATAVDELEIGLTAAAAPVHTGSQVMAIGLSGPSPRLADQLPHLGELLIEHAQQLAETLGRRSRKEGVA